MMLSTDGRVGIRNMTLSEKLGGNICAACHYKKPEHVLMMKPDVVGYKDLKFREYAVCTGCAVKYRKKYLPFKNTYPW